VCMAVRSSVCAPVSVILFTVLLRDMVDIYCKYSLNQTYAEYFTTQVESFFGGVMLLLFLPL